MYRKAWLVFVVFVAAAAGGFVPSLAQNQPSPASGVLATVNGVPITDEDVSYALARMGAHQMGGRAVNKKNVLDAIIQQELVYQEAVKTGLETDPTYQKDLRKLEVQVKAFKRGLLSRMFLQREIPRRAKVSDAEAQEYYAKNTARLRTEFHLWQILKRNKDQIEQVLKELERGESFEEVAGKGMPKLPAGVNKPWELGYLRWVQLPKAWRDVVYSLKPGERSGILQGPNRRFWIIKLIDKRENPTVSFENSKPSIIKMLRADKIQRLREEITRELREKAHITYTK